jgi:signal transduction histidine kinase
VRAREGSVGSFGLFSIRERLELLGGGLDIKSSPDSGSRFTLWVPLEIEVPKRGNEEAVPDPA